MSLAKDIKSKVLTASTKKLLKERKNKIYKKFDFLSNLTFEQDKSLGESLVKEVYPM